MPPPATADVSNPPLSPWIRVLTGLVLVFLCYGTTLLFTTTIARPRWPWTIPPFNARFLGSIYVAEAASVLFFLITNRWSPGRVALTSAATFTTIATIGTLEHLDLFVTPKRMALWFFLYGVYIVLPLLALWFYRDLPRPAPLPVLATFQSPLRIAGGALIAYGVAMLLLPATATAFWPWPIDHMHSRIYSGIFIAGGVALLLIAKDGARDDFLITGLFELTFGVFAIIGLVLAQLETGKPIWSQPGTWVWILLFAALAALGGLLVREALATPPRRS